MVRPTRAIVDLGAIEENLRAITRFVTEGRAARSEERGPASEVRGPSSEARKSQFSNQSPTSNFGSRTSNPGPRTSDFGPRTSGLGPRVLAVVKANAYGHGASAVGLALERAGAQILACADIEEGIVLRKAGVRIPILVFGALGISDLDGVFEHDLTPTISTPSAAVALAIAARNHDRPLHCHLKIDTGMNRLGFRHDNLERTLPDIAASPHLVIDAVYTHFATADEPEHPAFAKQSERFERACETIAALGIHPRWRHAANSAALLRDKRVWYDFVRPGLLLYGIVPPPLSSTLALRPALSLHSRIVHVKGMRPGEGTGYGLKTVVDRPSTIAVVPAGYADGLDRRLAGRGYMLVRGRRVPIVGSVCMDMTTIDVTGMDVSTGDEVVIVGEQGGESIGVREIAAAIGTIPYELLCHVGTRIERIYNPDAEGGSLETRRPESINHEP